MKNPAAPMRTMSISRKKGMGSSSAAVSVFFAAADAVACATTLDADAFREAVTDDMLNECAGRNESKYSEAKTTVVHARREQKKGD